jgi:non-homologous end joining protein Ku
MAPRANWKGFLRLSLVTCPIALFPATSESEKISFNQINKKTGHRIPYLKVDAETATKYPMKTSSRATRSTRTATWRLPRTSWRTSRSSPLAPS